MHELMTGSCDVLFRFFTQSDLKLDPAVTCQKTLECSVCGGSCVGDPNYRYGDFLVNLDDDPFEAHNLLEHFPEVWMRFGAWWKRSRVYAVLFGLWFFLSFFFCLTYLFCFFPMFFLSFFGDFLANLDDEPLETHNLLEQCPEAPRLNTIKSMMENVPTGGPRGECFSFVVRFVSLSLVSFCLFFPSFFFFVFSRRVPHRSRRWPAGGTQNVMEQFPKVRMSEKCPRPFFVRFRTARMYWWQDYLVVICATLKGFTSRTDQDLDYVDPSLPLWEVLHDLYTPE